MAKPKELRVQSDVELEAQLDELRKEIYELKNAL